MESMNRVLKQLCFSVKKKKELSCLDDSFVQEKIRAYLKGNPTVQKKILAKGANEKSREYQETVKAVRKHLREIYGMFILAGYQKKNEQTGFQDILKTHQSTRERVQNYPEIYIKLWNIIEPLLDGRKAINVLDLGCGMNPVSAPLLMNIFRCEVHYYAYDISSQDMDFIRRFFKHNNIQGSAVQADLTKDYERIISDNKPALCLMLKLLDTLETQQRHSSKKLLDHVFKITDVVAVSFPKTGISGRKTISQNRRAWLENFLKKQGKEWESFCAGNEMFYIIKKKVKKSEKILMLS